MEPPHGTETQSQRDGGSQPEQEIMCTFQIKTCQLFGAHI